MLGTGTKVWADDVGMTVFAQVNGQTLEGMNIETARSLIMGPIGSDVTFTLMRNTGGTSLMMNVVLKRNPGGVSPGPMFPGRMPQGAMHHMHRDVSPPGVQRIRINAPTCTVCSTRLPLVCCVP
jgi:hypothetical protein